MNFLSHDFILPRGSGPLTRIGSALPDLWARVPRRPLPLVVMRRLQASDDDEAKALRVGIDSHLRSDASFHGHAEFHRRNAWLAPRLARAWPGLKHPALAAHVLVEMLLDSWLIDRDPDRLDRYYACFSSDNIRSAARWSADDDDMADGVVALLVRFSSPGFLRDYRRAQGVASRFARTIAFTSFGRGTQAPEDRLTVLVRESAAALADGSDALLEDVRNETHGVRASSGHETPTHKL